MDGKYQSMFNDNFYLFDLMDVPGKDSERVLRHLEKCFKITWEKYPEIKKSDDKYLLEIQDRTHSITFEIDESRCGAVLSIDGKESFKYRIRWEEGSIKVYNREILLILRMFDENDDEGFDHLAQIIIRNGWNPIQELIAILHSDNSDESRKAGAVLLNIGDLSINPLISKLDASNVQKYVWDIKRIVDLHIENRLKIAKILEAILLDKRVLPPQPLPPGTEMGFAPERVCEEAYLMLRVLLSFDENEEEQFSNSHAFLIMSEGEKDAEIDRILSTKKWIALSEHYG